MEAIMIAILMISPVIIGYVIRDECRRTQDAIHPYAKYFR